MVDWNGARFDPKSAGGHYESWFLRANDPTGNRAFWIRYTVFSPAGRPQDAVGELWAITFDRAAKRNVAVKENIALGRCSFASAGLAVSIGDARLDDSTLRGRASANGHVISWDLRFSGGDQPLLFFPERLYSARLPRAKSVVPRPLVRFAGTIDVDGVALAITDWVGSQNHNWGSRHTDRYAWGQVAGFDDHPDAFLECSTARLKIGPVWTPPMSPVVLRLGDDTLAWNGLTRVVRALGAYAPYQWHIETTSKLGTLEMRMEAIATDFVALRYANPPGGSKICLNSKIATCEVILQRPGRPTLRLRSNRAAFEILDDTAPLAPVV